MLIQELREILSHIRILFDEIVKFVLLCWKIHILVIPEVLVYFSEYTQKNSALTCLNR